MTRKIFVSLALLTGMASPAFAQNTRTINVWGAQLEAPGVLQRIFEAPAAGTNLTDRSMRWTAAGTPASAQAPGPSVPSYERGRGQQTGGSDRVQIPN